MNRNLFRRFLALTVAVLVLLPVLAVPIGAVYVFEPVSGGESQQETTSGQKTTGFAVNRFENVKTTGSNLRGKFQYSNGVTGAQYQLSGYLVALEPDTWYHLKYTESVVMTGSSLVCLLPAGKRGFLLPLQRPSGASVLYRF